MVDNNSNPPKPPPLPPRNPIPPADPSQPPPLPKRPKRPGEPDENRDLSKELKTFLRNMNDVNAVTRKNNKQLEDLGQILKDLRRNIDSVNKDSSTLSGNLKKAASRRAVDTLNLAGSGDIVKETANQLFIEKQQNDAQMPNMDLGDMSKALPPTTAKWGGFKDAIGGIGQSFTGARSRLNDFNGAAEAVNSNMGKLHSSFGTLSSIFLKTVAAQSLLTLAFEAFYVLLQSTYDYVDKKIYPALSKTNKEFGAMGATTNRLAYQSMALGNEFELLGLGFETGRDALLGLAKAMDTISVPPDIQRIGVTLSQGFGVGEEAAGALIKTLQRTTGSVSSLRPAMDAAADGAVQFGIPLASVMNDIASTPELVARFGSANIAQLAKSSSAARSYGLTIKEVNNAFGNTMDTFEGTASVASKLNSVFGTNINAMELMMETDPQKRFEMVRKELLAQGKSYDSLDPFQKNFLEKTLGLTAAQAQLAFGSEQARQTFLKQQQQMAKDAQVTKDWDHYMNNLKSTVMNFSAELSQTAIEVGNLVAKFLGFGSAKEVFDSMASSIHGLFQNFRTFFQEWNKSIEESTTGESAFGDALQKYITSGQALLDIGKSLEKVWWKIMSIGSRIFGDDKMTSALDKYTDTDEFAKKYQVDTDKIGAELREQEKNRSADMDFSPESNLGKSELRKRGNQQPLLVVPAAARNAPKSEDIHITPMPIYLDSRKIGEAQIRAAVGAR